MAMTGMRTGRYATNRSRGNTIKFLFLSRIPSQGTIYHFNIIEIHNNALYPSFRGQLVSGHGHA